jgi:hypothetical protein
VADIIHVSIEAAVFRWLCVQYSISTSLMACAIYSTSMTSLMACAIYSTSVTPLMTCAIYSTSMTSLMTYAGYALPTSDSASVSWSVDQRLLPTGQQMDCQDLWLRAAMFER